MSDTDRLLVVEHVAKRYVGPDEKGDVSVLTDVSFSARRGESLAITGPSGAGKSTLLNIIGGLDKADSGRVIVDGQDLSKLGEAELAGVRNRKTGFVFQLHHLLPQCTALENVLIPTLPLGRAQAGESEDRARTLLQSVGLSERLSFRPGQLSGGERQRVAVVRALINRPKILLADEPTGSLDRGASEALCELLADLNRDEGTALVVVSHSADVAARMDRRLRLIDGVLVDSAA